MKRPISPTYTFNPGGATLNLSGIAGFGLGNLFAVINLRLGAIVYAPSPGYGATAAGTVLTLQAPMTGHGSSDPLMILYDDGGKPAEDASIQQIATALQQGLQNDQAALASLNANATWQAALLSATQAITAALKAQIDIAPLFVSDGTSTFVRRETVNEGTGAITVAFENMDGSAASPSVAALAPISSKSRVSTPVYYDVVAAASGYALTDTLAEVVITDTVTGGVTATWQNLTQGTTLAGPPPSTNIRRSASVVTFATGQQTAANSLSVVLSSDGPFATSFGGPSDAAAVSDMVAATFMALFRRGLARWTTLLGLLPAGLGRATMAGSFPVVLASDQAAVPATIGKAATAGDASVTVGGTAQTLFAGAVPPNGWKVANPDPAEDLWISDSGLATPNGQGCYRLPAGGILTTEPGERPCGPVSVYGATAGHVITARSW